MARALSAAGSRALSVAAIGLVVSCALFRAEQQQFQTFTGTVNVLNVEMGCAVLRTEDGVYELASKKKLEPGTRVTIKGVIRNDWGSICMVGPILEVVSVRAATSN